MSLRVGDLADDALQGALASGRFGIRTGPFWTRIRSPEPAVAAGLRLLYASHPADVDPPFADFHVALDRVSGPRRWLWPQVTFTLDGIEPFQPFDANHGLPLLEWGLNWCIINGGHRWLVLHSAVLARGDDAVLLPAVSGSGKSTLCAALALSGWRLLSDELAMIEPETGLVRPIVRAISLKNASIEIIGREFPYAVISGSATNTKKGTVALVRPPSESVSEMQRPARIRWVVFPKWLQDAPRSLVPVSQSDVLLGVISNALNYNVQGEGGFNVATSIARSARGYRFTYSKLGDALKTFGDLT